MLSVSILCYNKSEVTKRCLEHLSKSTASRDDIEYILTDNNSSDNTLDVLEQADLPNKVIIKNETNLGFGAGHNKALTKASGAYFLVLNNDLYINDNDWVDKLLSALKVGCVALVGLKGRPSRLNNEGHGRHGLAQDFVEGSFLAGKSELFRKFGLFSPAIKMFLFEDSDLSLRFKQMGYDFAYIDVNHTHDHWTTLATIDDTYLGQIMQHNEKVLQSRWGKYLRTRSFNNSIVVRFNSWGIGDAVCGTSALEALRKDHPTAHIYVETYYPQVFENNPNVYKTLEYGKVNHDDFDRFVDMDLGQARNEPQWKVYEQLAYTTITDPKPKLYFTKEEEARTEGFLYHMREKYPILCGCGLLMSRTGWEGRNWSVKHITKLLDRVSSSTKNKVGFVLFGKQVPKVEHKNALNCVDKLTLREFFAAMYKMDFFIGVDSLPFHVAQGAELPGVVLFGATDPSTRIIDPSRLIPCYRDELDCKFCYSKGEMPHNVVCRFRNQQCLFQLDSQRVANTVVDKLRREQLV